MKASSVPVKFPLPFAANAGSGFIRSIPTASQIGITAGAASLNDGFPPVTLLPVGGGGTPPFGQDFNGILNQISAWTQWYNAGAPIYYDATFSSNVNGYPAGALISKQGVLGDFWISLVDNNMSNPDTGGANWIGLAAYILSFVKSTNTFQQLVANPVIYVGGSGASDSNSGTTSSAPKATIAGALAAAATFSFATTSLTIQVAAGTYASPGTINPIGGPLVINGAGAGLTILTGAVTCQTFVTFSNVNIAGPAPSTAGTLLAQLGGNITLTNVTVSAGGGLAALETGAGGTIAIQSGVTLTGNGTYCLFANGGTIFLESAGAITVLGSPSYSGYFAVATNQGSIFTVGTVSFSGSATGTRYGVALNGVIQTNGGGPNFFPGTATGTQSSGGQYV